MKDSRKIILVMVSIICIIILLVGSIAYYRIVVNGSIKGSTGNAVFVLRDSDNSVWDNKVIDLGKINPGDSGEFTVTMDASGSSVDMYATLEIERTNLPTNLKFYTTSDHKSELHKYYSFLETTAQTETLTIYWYWNPYISDEEDSKFINVSNLEANIRVSAVQISEYAMMKNGYKMIYVTGPGNLDTSTEFWSITYKPYIKTITFGNDLSNLPSSCTAENLCWDISYSSSQKKKVYGYLIDSGLTVSETSSGTTTEKVLYNLYIVSEAPIFAPTDCNHIFAFNKPKSNGYISNLTQINFNSNFNTSKVTDMSAMFSKCSSLTSLDLSSFNTSNVTKMNSMFWGCSSLTSLDLSSFNTLNVTDMMFMFGGCTSLTSLDLSSLNTMNVISMRGMFRGCSSLTSLDLSSFNTSNVTDMASMFSMCSSLTALDLRNFNTSKVIYFYNRYYEGMFYNCSSLTSLDLSNFNTLSVIDMSGMFSGCSSLITLDLSNFNTSSVTNMSNMFSNCKKLQVEINIMNTGTTSYYSMFYGALTDADAYVILGYTTDTQSIAEAMKATASSVNQSKITLKQI